MIARRTVRPAELSATADATLDPAVLVECVDLARTYGSGAAAVVAVHGATCRIKPGARVALTGPSGSGKSTLLHLFAGLEHPTTGTIDWPALPRRTEIGLVFQGPSLLPALDVTENVALPLLLAGHRPDDATERALQAMSRLGIDELAGSLPDELSGGQAQRVAIARVLAARPLLILADEPTGQLDRHTADRVLSVLLSTADEVGAALVIATHDPTVAGRLAEQWQMRDGRLDRGRDR
ncbi:ABC transporter ATP-binding protein [Actinophytocola sp.]|jgi:putative ABC transport system ATP-binding protein|uniref:ABC transporter ATP-binding protein n=1 Tax=Actinophytocola sp. TaxID=1872138 RepID=UPI002ED86252